MGRRDAAAPGTPHDFVTYYVKDNGLGIPEAYQEKAFQVFQRVHPGVASGDGMGLAIVPPGRRAARRPGLGRVPGGRGKHLLRGPAGHAGEGPNPGKARERDADPGVKGRATT